MSLTKAPETTEVGTQATDEEKIIKWRQEELERAGYNKRHARTLAKRHTCSCPTVCLDARHCTSVVDLERARRLVMPVEKGGQGAPHHVAASILL
jgi:hypothetical protein